MTSEEQRIIAHRCPQCSYGAMDYRGAKCHHPHHPGSVGGWGTEWAADCEHHTPDGKTGRMTQPKMIRS